MLLEGRRCSLQARAQAIGNVLTLYKAVPSDSALFWTWWEQAVSHGCHHRLPGLLSSAGHHLKSAMVPP